MKKRKEKVVGYSPKNSYLLLTLIIVVGVGIAYIIINQIYSTGEVVGSSKCVDSDGGLNYYVYGYVTYRNMNYYDYCSGSYLIERYCSTSNKLASQKYRCPNTCYNGQCDAASCNNECSTSGLKECVFTSTGAAYKTCGNYDADECLEWSSFTYCPAGYTCQNGLCIASCTPTTCYALGKECDSWPNGCGGYVYCGNCSSGYICSNGQCIMY